MVNKTRALESPFTLIEGSKHTYSVTFQSAGTITNPAVDAFKDRQTSSYSTSVFPAGSPSASGNVVTLPELQVVDGDGGSQYAIVVTATHDGDTDVRKFIVNVEKKESI